MYTDEQILSMMQGSPGERDEAMKFFFTDPKLEHTVIQKILGKGGADYDARDAYQEGFKVFYRHLLQGKFEGRSSLRTYFVSICIRCWLDGLKKNFYQRTTLVEDEPTLDQEYDHTPEVELLSKERKKQLREVLSLLGERCRQVILLGHQGYSGEEITSMLGLEEVGLVRKIRYRCLNKLKEMMRENPVLLSLLKSLSNG